MSLRDARRIRDFVEQTPLVDTHEHLVEESMRLQGTLDPRLVPCDDWALLFRHYLGNDLRSAGMSADDQARFLSPDTPGDQKYRLLAPAWERTRHTGYAQAVRHTLRGLYGVDDLDARSVPILAERYRAMVRPGFYREILREKSNLESCQVNSLQRIFMETGQPDLLPQDLSFLAFSSGGPDLDTVEAETGKRPSSLDGWIEIIDWYFATYGPRAVAAKNQAAYTRRLDYAAVTRQRADPLFVRHARAEPLDSGEIKDLQDYLFRYCVGKATQQGLPVKIHTGYLAGVDVMPLARLRKNASDLCTLLQDFPDTRFVLMHIGYPYQDEYIALAKHYRNVSVDLCWAWIINPAATVRFLKEFLLAAPASKLFPFGGDYITVETVYGHSRIARQGITQALSELVQEGWLAMEEVPPLVERLFRGNAHEVFPPRT
jgi:predicted TIM-barrel fold metal-dependent hydrolase